MVLNVSQIAKLIEMRENNQPYRAIEQELGTTQDILRYWIINNRPDLRRVKIQYSGIPGSARLQHIIALRIEGHNQSQVAEILGLSRERIRQILNKYAPVYAGFERATHTCVCCDEEDFALKTHKTGHARYAFRRSTYLDSSEFLCVRCAKTVLPYMRLMHTKETYQDRYEFIATRQAQGAVLAHLGPEYYSIRAQPTAKTAMYTNWAAKTKGIYLRAIENLQKLERKNPRLRELYNRTKELEQ